MEQILEVIWNTKVACSEIAKSMEQPFKVVWDFKPVRVDLRSHVNVLLEGVYMGPEMKFQPTLNSVCITYAEEIKLNLILGMVRKKNGPFTKSQSFLFWLNKSICRCSSHMISFCV